MGRPELFDYQVDGVDFLASKSHALLADEMGLGKTPQTILALKKIKASRVHVICPSVAKYNWQDEFKKWGNIDAHVSGEGKHLSNAPVVISSFEYAKKFMSEYMATKKDVLVVDEAHFLKEPTSQRTKVVLGAGGLIHNAKRFWALSGTPAPNHAGELWVLLYTFGQTKLSYEGFIARYCNCRLTGGRYSRRQIMGTNTLTSPELKAMIKNIAIRRLKKDVLDLPPFFHNAFAIEGDSDAHILQMYPDLKEKIQQELKELSIKLDFHINGVDDSRLLNILSLMSQSVSSLRRYHGLKKVRPVAQLIAEELRAGLYKKIVIFGIHTDVLTTLNKMLAEFNPAMVTGKTADRKKPQQVKMFQNDPTCRVFVGNIQAAGTAITLTAANQVGMIEQDWVPGNNKQACDRLHRIGQTESVTARHFFIRNSIDEKITAALTRKTQEISTFID